MVVATVITVAQAVTNRIYPYGIHRVVLAVITVVCGEPLAEIEVPLTVSTTIFAPT